MSSSRNSAHVERQRDFYTSRTHAHLQASDEDYYSSKISAHEDKENTFTVTGELEFHGVTKSVTFDATLVGEADTRMGPRSGFEGELVIQRSDFGMTGMLAALGDEVKLIFFIEGVKK